MRGSNTASRELRSHSRRPSGSQIADGSTHVVSAEPEAGDLSSRLDLDDGECGTGGLSPVPQRDVAAVRGKRRRRARLQAQRRGSTTSVRPPVVDEGTAGIALVAFDGEEAIAARGHDPAGGDPAETRRRGPVRAADVGVEQAAGAVGLQYASPGDVDPRVHPAPGGVGEIGDEPARAQCGDRPQPTGGSRQVLVTARQETRERSSRLTVDHRDPADLIQRSDDHPVRRGQEGDRTALTPVPRRRSGSPVVPGCRSGRPLGLLRAKTTTSRSARNPLLLNTGGRVGVGDGARGEGHEMVLGVGLDVGSSVGLGSGALRSVAPPKPRAATSPTVPTTRIAMTTVRTLDGPDVAEVSSSSGSSKSPGSAGWSGSIRPVSRAPSWTTGPRVSASRSSVWHPWEHAHPGRRR